VSDQIRPTFSFSLPVIYAGNQMAVDISMKEKCLGFFLLFLEKIKHQAESF
jgi:hypothetical protein